MGMISDTLSNMVSALGSLGMHSVAESKLLQLIVLRSRHLGPSHESTVEALLQLGVCVDAQRRPEEALQIYRAVLEVTEERFGPQHPWVSICCFYVANQCHSSSKELELGMLAASRSLEIAAKAYPAGHAFITEVLRVQGGLCDRAGQPEEAARAWKRAMKNLVIGESRTLGVGEMSVMKELQHRYAQSLNASNQLGRATVSSVILDRLPDQNLGRSSRSRQESFSRSGNRPPSLATASVPPYLSSWQISAKRLPAGTALAADEAGVRSPDFEASLQKWRLGSASAGMRPENPIGALSRDRQALTPVVLTDQRLKHYGAVANPAASSHVEKSNLPSFIPRLVRHSQPAPVASAEAKF